MTSDDPVKRWLDRGGITPETSRAPASSPERKRRALAAWAEGHAHFLAGRFGPAIAPLRRALSLLEADLGPDDPGLFETLRLLGDSYHYLNVRSDARKTYERILTIHERRGLDEGSLVPILDNLAEILEIQGEAARAAERRAWAERLEKSGHT